MAGPRFKWFPFLCITALMAVAGAAVANTEPSFDWTVQSVDAAGTVSPKRFQKGKFDEANMQARSLCSQQLDAQMNRPAASGVRVTMR